jgi:hypothetical protein
MMVALPIFYNTKNAQITTLIVIQSLEIIRFLIIWPFKTRFRNFFRLFLDLCLLTFFITILIQSIELPDIMSGDNQRIVSAVEIYYSVGWVGFVMVFIFNICHIAIWIYDCMICCKKSNR